MVKLNAGNNSQTLLDGAITDTDTSMTVLDGSIFPDAPFAVTIEDEIIYVVAKSGNIFSSLLRGQEGTAAAAHAKGVSVENRMTAGMYNALATQEEVDEHKAETTSCTAQYTRDVSLTGTWTITLPVTLAAAPKLMTFEAILGDMVSFGNSDGSRNNNLHKRTDGVFVPNGSNCIMLEDGSGNAVAYAVSGVTTTTISLTRSTAGTPPTGTAFVNVSASTH